MYDDSFKAWALFLYHISGKAYRFHAKLLNLPSKSSLTGMVSRFASDLRFSEKSILLKQWVDATTDSAKISICLGKAFIALVMKSFYFQAKNKN